MKDEVSRAKCDVLVCFAVKEEARSFQRLTKAAKEVSILITGIGRTNAEVAVGKFLHAHKPSFVLTCGFAGGLNPELQPSEVVFSTDDVLLRERLLAANARQARMFCAKRIAITAVEKEALRATSSADIVEMESEAIQDICREQNIRCATVRAISDTAAEDLPLDFNQLSRPDMNLDYVKLAWAVAKSPGKIVELLRLRNRCRFAAENLAEVLAKIILR